MKDADEKKNFIEPPSIFDEEHIPFTLEELLSNFHNINDTYKLLPTPTPPLTINAPVPVVVDAVELVILNAPLVVVVPDIVAATNVPPTVVVPPAVFNANDVDDEGNMVFV